LKKKEVHRFLVIGSRKEDTPGMKKNIFLFAARQGELEIMRKMVKYGADPMKCDGYDNNALHYASYFHFLTMAKFLMNLELDVNSGNHIGNTPLHLACETNGFKLVEFLIANGADIHIQNTFFKQTALHVAIITRSWDCVDVLLMFDIDLSVCDSKDKSIIDYLRESDYEKKGDYC